MLTIATWRWTPPPGYRSKYAPWTVRILRDMVARHYPHPHRFVCITDRPDELDADIETIADRGDYKDVPSPHGGKNPSCYRRLRLFDPGIADVLGPRFVSLDLDSVLTADVTPLWHRDEDFVMWGDTGPRSLYNGSMVLMTAGARRKVWETFDPHTSPREAIRAGYWGSDQGWISKCLGPGEARWTKADGVYSYRNDLSPRPQTPLPENARIVFFHGSVDPWDRRGQMLPWVRQHYGVTEVAA